MYVQITSWQSILIQTVRWAVSKSSFDICLLATPGNQLPLSGSSNRSPSITDTNTIINNINGMTYSALRLWKMTTPLYKSPKITSSDESAPMPWYNISLEIVPVWKAIVTNSANTSPTPAYSTIVNSISIENSIRAIPTTLPARKYSNIIRSCGVSAWIATAGTVPRRRKNRPICNLI